MLESSDLSVITQTLACKGKTGKNGALLSTLQNLCGHGLPIWPCSLGEYYIMSIATLRHPGLSRAVIEYLQSHRIEELFDVLSVAISVNMLKEHSTGSSGIPQVKNTKFLLSGRYKYFLNVYCSLYMGHNL